MRIGELAKAAGVGVEAVRYYQRIGLLGYPDKPFDGVRRYGEGDLARLNFLRRAQNLGFMLDEIAGLLQLASSTCPDPESLARHQLELVETKVADLMRLARVLEGVLQQAQEGKLYEGCPMLEALSPTKLT